MHLCRIRGVYYLRGGPLEMLGYVIYLIDYLLAATGRLAPGGTRPVQLARGINCSPLAPTYLFFRPRALREGGAFGGQTGKREREYDGGRREHVDPQEDSLIPRRPNKLGPTPILRSNEV
jgi:hypothetical protein